MIRFARIRAALLGNREFHRGMRERAIRKPETLERGSGN
jgi:hypothetical protein